MTEQEFNGELIRRLTGEGALTGQRWKRALEKVPRGLFAPSTGWFALDEPGARGEAINRAAKPDAWLTAVYSNGSIVTQRDDGETPPDAPSGHPSSSLSAPGTVLEFLELLDPRPNDRVLEIGTGTGWTAALLSAELGEENVTTIEVDERVMGDAEENLKAAGFSPLLIVGDGALGYPEGGPYDRVHVTCGVSTVPFAWVEQTRPGGKIVTPWQPHVQQGWKVELTVGLDTAYGRFHGPCTYMMLRDQRARTLWKAHHADQATVTRTELDPRTVAQAGPGFDLAAAARVPGLGIFHKPDDEGGFSLLLCEVGESTGSWAACDYEPGLASYEVTQYGDRSLWDELSDAYMWWVRHGSPGPDQFGLIVTPSGESVWLGDPSRTLTPP